MTAFDKIKTISEDKTRKFEEYIKMHFGSDSKVGKFFQSLKNRMGIGSPERNATDTYERGMNIVPTCISANEKEIPVKQYNIAVLRNFLKFERAEGRMQVTNKRIIFRAAGRSIGGRTTLQHEFAIDEIAGIEAKNNYKWSFLYLVFAILIISLAFQVIYRPSAIYGIMSPMRSETYRIYNVLNPKHVQQAYLDERTAIFQTRQAVTKVEEAKKKVEEAYEPEERAGINVRFGIERTRRVQTGTDWWGTPQFRNETFRDRSAAALLEAQNLLDSAIAARVNYQRAEQVANAELETARENEAAAIKKRDNTVKLWRFLMTIWGVVLGVIGLAPFFLVYKKFGLKLFLLIISIFGFSLALAASEIRFFNWLRFISIITTMACIFFYCFRPNLVISIKNKMGQGEGPVTIRCNESLNRLMEVIAFAIVAIPVIAFWSMNAVGSLGGDMVGDIIGSILQIALPIILIIILLVSIVRLLMNKNSETSLRGDTGFAEVISTKETESAIREIGAMIGDIQKLGDLGLEKWIKNNAK
jgi:hypothetical protein